MVWLKPETGFEYEATETKAALSVDPMLWVEDDGLRNSNLGVRLLEGLAQIHVKGPLQRDFARAFYHLNRDAAAFGYAAITKPHREFYPIRLEDGGASVPRWRRTWPRKFFTNGEYSSIEFSYTDPPAKGAALVPEISHPLPGSFIRLKDGLRALVTWRAFDDGPLLDASDIALRMPPIDLSLVVRAAAYAIVLHHVRAYVANHGDFGGMLARILAGFLARAVIDGESTNAEGSPLEGVVWAPIDSGEKARDLIEFLGVELNEPPKETLDIFMSYMKKLRKNPNNPVPDHRALGQCLGHREALGIRSALRAGKSNLDILDDFAAQYPYDSTADKYYDQESLLKHLEPQRTLEHLIRIHAAERVMIGKKATNAFKLYSEHPIRTTVEHADIYPDYPTGAILRVSSNRHVLDDDSEEPNSYLALNVYAGFPHQPAISIDRTLMQLLESNMHKMFRLITADNAAQESWLKKYLAWIIQNPSQKQQVAPILVGGQRLGKSFFGCVFLRYLFGDQLWGRLSRTDFATRFYMSALEFKLIVFIDEFVAEGRMAVENLKETIRTDYLRGEDKGLKSRMFNVLARLVMASNRADIGLAPEDAADRGNYFIKGFTPAGLHMSDREFQQWTFNECIFYESEFVPLLKDPRAVSHLMRYFVDLEVSKAELEDLTLSSRDDADIIAAQTSKEREIARAILEDARIWEDYDIVTWFNMSNLTDAVLKISKQHGLFRVAATRVLDEFMSAGLISTEAGGFFKFRFKYGDLLDKFSVATGLQMKPSHVVGLDDYGENDIGSRFSQPEWRGKRNPYDEPDHENSYMRR